MSRPKVYLNQSMPDRFLDQLRAVCDVTFFDEASTGSILVPREEFLAQIRGVDAIGVVLPIKVDAEALDAAGPQLKVIGTQSVGLDHIDLDECARRGVKVGYTPEVLTDAVAEATIGLTLSVARRHKEGIEAVVQGLWGSTWADSLYLCGKEIKNSVVGIVGLGRIGLAVAKRLQPFQVKQFLYCGRNPRDSASEVGAKFVTFEDLLEQSDFVIVTCSVHPGNHKLFNAAAFKRMKKTAILINTSRGVVVDQDDLYAALSSGEIHAAGLDVTTPEPLPHDHRLLSLPNCTVLPHLGSSSVTARSAMMDLTVRNILAGLKGEPLVTPVPGV